MRSDGAGAAHPRLDDRTFGVVIVGAGHAGRHVATELRDGGYDDSILVLDAVEHPWHERPPLSKGYLRGELRLAEFTPRSAEQWRASDVDVLTGVTAIGLDADARVVRLADGRTVSYERLVWATGGSARRLPLPGFDSPRVRTLRHLADADALRPHLGNGRRLVIVGGGFIGLEVAASARSLGTEVVVLEALPRILGRVAALPVGDHLLSLHRAHGVDVRLEARIDGLDEGPTGATVLLADDDPVAADTVLVGIGLIPEVTALAEAGATTGDGVVVDSRCRTDLGGVWAVGDIANRSAEPYAARSMRIESVANATETAAAVAADILGREPKRAVPWFWTHQYDTKLQIAGLNLDVEETVLRGDPASGRFSVLSIRDGRLAAVEGVNRVGDFAAGRKFVGRRITGSIDALRDPARPLAELVEP